MLTRLLFLFLLIDCVIGADGQVKTVAIKDLKQSTKSKSTNSFPPPPPGPKIVTPVKSLTYLIPPLNLLPDSIDYTPSSFYYHSVIDSTNIDSIGFGILPKDYKKQTIKTVGKKETQLYKYLKSVTKTDTSLLPVVLVIKTFHISEQQINKADLKAKIELYFNIYSIVDNKLFFLDKIGGTLENTIYVGFKREYDKIISYNLKTINERIEQLMQSARPFLNGLAKGTEKKVEIRNTITDNNNDTLFITNNFTLNWSDYRGNPISDKGLNPSLRLGIDIQNELTEDKVSFTILIEPAFIRKRSWAGSQIRSEALLRHEYYKTQLIYLYALELKKRLTETTIPLKGFTDSVYTVYGLVNDDLEIEMQKYSYDTENGFSKAQQEKWEKLITARIEELKNYNSFFSK